MNPNTFQTDIHQIWERGNRLEAISQLLVRINNTQPDVPTGLGLQYVYYLFLLDDLSQAERYLRILLAIHPDDIEVLENLAVVLKRQGKSKEAFPFFEQVVQQAPFSCNAWDGLTACLETEQRFEEARRAGERSLELKTQQAQPLPDWRPPQQSPHQLLEQRRRSGAALNNVVSFSLWGNHPRYLRGSLRNALLIPVLYPGWHARFYVDETVPQDFRSVLDSLGCDVQLMPANQSLRKKLCWRFLVANDPEVGRFLVRDCDSVVSQREAAAVQQWLESDRWFHVMRDWWTHTDPILAGMWGGVGSVLPDLAQLLDTYNPKAKETANVDQWFLRDVLWGSIRHFALVHDRCFRCHGSQEWPTASPADSWHVGMNEYAVQQGNQSLWLDGWIKSYPYLSGDGLPKKLVKIDLRSVKTVWISLEEHSDSSARMKSLLLGRSFLHASWAPGVRVSASGDVAKERLHAAGVALAHRQALLANSDDQPLLILEDDIEIENDALLEIELPIDADAVWVGISRYGKPILQPFSASLCRVSRMFSSHAVLYLSKSYKEHAIHCAEQCLECNLPWDVALAFYQKDYSVYALRRPIFYQSKEWSGVHDFEAMTRGAID